MKPRPVNNRACSNPDCEFQGKFGQGNITRHSFFKHRRGRRRRYVCGACGGTFCTTRGSAITFRVKLASESTIPQGLKNGASRFTRRSAPVRGEQVLGAGALTATCVRGTAGHEKACRRAQTRRTSLCRSP